jgi:hypothetical protein
MWEVKLPATRLFGLGIPGSPDIKCITQVFWNSWFISQTVTRLQVVMNVGLTTLCKLCSLCGGEGGVLRKFVCLPSPVHDLPLSFDAREWPIIHRSARFVTHDGGTSFANL